MNFPPSMQPPSRPALAIILARAGSKGVPGKNIAMVGGRSCLAWTLDAARESTQVGRIVVSTDGSAIRTAARSLGAEVVDRPPHLATDMSTVDEAARHAVLQVEHWEGGGESDPRRAVVILYANVPARPPGLVDLALARLAQSGCDSVQSYSPVGKMHPWWMARVEPEGGQVAPWEGAQLNHGVYRRQDLPACFVPDGGVLVVTRRALFLGVAGVEGGPHAFLGQDRRGVINPEGSVVDIDGPRDLALADTVLRAQAKPLGAGGAR